MSGPVWRFESKRSGRCGVCLRPAEGLYVEGEVTDNGHRPARLVCADCFGRWGALVTAGEAGKHVTAPAYARIP
ncbi:MAG: hypothetical protein KA072_07670 [Thermoanaerobaculaceae bacterium]|nr:hypothetical protein [Thermoanaerobaculaceae bacterium]MDI9621928.1 hypothetical protein [Acidobacteriota bacterium]NLH12258.1 hypothetical protein [Holophagae bacterium]HPW56445.1 hypothetical protein [Thermoanaerobaculaceae bacterium]